MKAYGNLQEGDRIVDGRIVDADGKPVQVRDSSGGVVDVKVCQTDTAALTGPTRALTGASAGRRAAPDDAPAATTGL